MGVHGLWRLIEPSGKPVPLETLENKVLAVDVSIWLHHIVKGFQDAKGAPVPNAHLLGIYHRVCKLLYFRIKPVFVFDGGVPVLKRQTIALRNQQKSKNLSEADRIHKNLLSALIKHSAISKVLSEKAKAAITAQTSPSKKATGDDELYVLPQSQSTLDSTITQDEDEDSGSDESSPTKYDLHSIDTESVEFKSLPADVRHEILTDLKETRKQSSWGKIHEMPTYSDDFSTYQMRRLLKRQSVQTALEEVEKEMGGHSLSLGELEKILKDQGVLTNVKGNRIASDENTRFLLIKDIKQAVEDAKKQNLPTVEENDEEVELQENKDEEKAEKNKGDQEFEDDLKKAIALSLEETPSTSKTSEAEEQPSTSEGKKIGGKGKRKMPLSFLADFEDADFDDTESSDDETIQTRLTAAQRYMTEYSGLTPNEITKILASKSGVSKKINIEEIKDKKQSSIQAAESTSDVSSKVTEASIESSLEDDKVTTSVTSVEVSTSTSKVPTEDESTVDVMSDSDSSNDDDFLDVQLEEGKKDSDAMEVVIKPDEPDDDLFKDIFTENNEERVCEVSSTQEKDIEGKKQFVSNNTEEFTNRSEVVEEEEKNIKKDTQEKKEDNSTMSTGAALKEKIEKLIKDYSKPKNQGAKPEEERKSIDLSVEQMNEMKENLRKEQAELLVERSTKERMASNITDQMYQEAQELLELFGVPYIIAPMEAEAQCAFLDLIGLTDGTITDDSDIWLFGGKTVYKNFFNQSKVVLEFKSDNIQHHYKLTREQMILLAMLVGSDYTIGLTGVGPVTALEILAAFPPKKQLMSGLAEFKSWVKKGKMSGPGRNSLRGKLKNVSFTESFPNPQIIQAYLEPQVDTNKEKFTWGKLDVVGLTEFARQKFGWTKTKTEEILNPILKRLQDNRAQKAITDYFKTEYKVDSGDTAKQVSRRVKTAIDRIGKGKSEEEEEQPKPKKRSKKSEEVDGEIAILKKTQARSKKRVKEIHKEVEKVVEEQKERKVNLKNLHKREVVPQKQKDKSEMLKNKIKAIEAFRKSKQGPGYVKKGAKVKREPKKDAGYLSESSSSD